jgi:hypothetical protein
MQSGVLGCVSFSLTRVRSFVPKYVRHYIPGYERNRFFIFNINGYKISTFQIVSNRKLLILVGKPSWHGWEIMIWGTISLLLFWKQTRWKGARKSYPGLILTLGSEVLSRQDKSRPLSVPRDRCQIKDVPVQPKKTKIGLRANFKLLKNSKKQKIPESFAPVNSIHKYQ